MIFTHIAQVILAIVFLIILLFVVYFVFSSESVTNMQNAISLKNQIVLFDGIMDFNTTQWNFNTYNKSKPSFKDLSPSINQNGGAEYSYNFWLYKDQSGLSNVTSSDIVLMLRGNKMKTPYLNNTNCELANTGSYILVKNPMIRMKSDGSAIVVEYNTITNPDAYRENGKNAINCSTGSWEDKNKGLLGIYNLNDYTYDKKWFMFTVVLKEINPDTDILYKNKTSCKIYINGINILDKTVESPYNSSYGSSTMRHNRAPLYVNPGDMFSTKGNESENPFNNSGDSSAILMADLSYFNYAITDDEIDDLFAKEFTKDGAVAPVDDSVAIDKYAIANLTEDSNNAPLPF
jgi:hypothetical protein